MNITCKITVAFLVVSVGCVHAARTRQRQNQSKQKTTVVNSESATVVGAKVEAVSIESIPQVDPVENIVLKPMEIIADVIKRADSLKSTVRKLVKEKADAVDIYALKDQVTGILSSMTHEASEHKDVLKEQANKKTVQTAFKKVNLTYLDWAEAIGHGKALAEEVFPEFYEIDQMYQNLQNLSQGM